VSPTSTRPPPRATRLIPGSTSVMYGDLRRFAIR
jgi:hypothetical protein